MSEPRWLPRTFFRAAQTQLVREHGGQLGLLDPAALGEVLRRPQDKYCRGIDEVAPLAAGYAFVLVRRRPFRDGNKRLALAAIYSFLHLNGRELAAPEAEAVSVLRRIEDGDMLEGELGDWVREHVHPRR
ncbi:MAG TPA: type II toxin-antitoxin system death-on-curing family toxin [Gammaproteobacteria bacterium]|nr:type II toxin-antitoxin system death-on-curing family toxin [Gammaproteobacteria bacterium]